MKKAGLGILVVLIALMCLLTGCGKNAYDTEIVSMGDIGQARAYVVTSVSQLTVIADLHPAAYSGNVDFAAKNEKYTVDYFEKNNLGLIFFTSDDYAVTIKNIIATDDILTVEFLKPRTDADETTSYACYIELPDKSIGEIRVMAV